MKDYNYETRSQNFLELISEPEYNYRKVLIVPLCDQNPIQNEDDDFPQIYNIRNSIQPIVQADLVFFELIGGGLKCLKDRYDFYKRNTVWFGQ
jgi:hypothetical protein